MARYIALCRFWTKFENLECEIHENRIFSNFLRVVCTRKKICSIVYFWRFFKICLSANNPEEFELLNVRFVHWTVYSALAQCNAVCLRAGQNIWDNVDPKTFDQTGPFWDPTPPFGPFWDRIGALWDRTCIQ